jgi:hypothetical protein
LHLAIPASGGQRKKGRSSGDLPFRFPLSDGSASTDRAQDYEENDCADHCDEDTVEIETRHCRVTQQIEDPTAQECPNDAYDDVADETAGALAGDKSLREESRDQAD